nr:MAG TPA: hypothetical protein [Caudoviricetes sp.]
MSLGLVPFDNTKVRQVFDIAKYFSKIISVRLLLCLYTDSYSFILICMPVSFWVLVLFILYLCGR